MDSQGQENSSRPQKWGSNLTALLSLKLLLLAFFILLNARSSYEAIKVNAVLESVYKAFNGKVVVDKNLTTQSAAVGPLENAAFLLEKVGRIFEAMLPAVYRENTPRGPMMVLELSDRSVFQPGESRLQPGRHLLLERLVEDLAGPQGQSLNYRFELLHGVKDGSAAGEALAFRRVAGLAAQLLQRGFPEERLSVGTFRADTGRMRFVLWVFDAPQKAALAADSATGVPRQ